MILDYGEFDHHQKNRNGQRENGIYYSSIGLLWKKFGKEYLKKLKVKSIDKTFEYIDKELIQYIDATDNMQNEYLDNKISPDFIKLCNPEWNENISEEEAFINALKLADSFWKVYIKHAIAEVEAIEIILKKIEKCKECYLIFDMEMPYRKAMRYTNNDNMLFIRVTLGFDEAFTFEEDQTDEHDVYRANGIEFVLSTNMDTERATWSMNETMYSTGGNVTIDELEEMLGSIRVEE